jgi:hypothetical protein
VARIGSPSVVLGITATVVMLMLLPSATELYAVNPTPFNEWDFDLLDVTAYQSQTFQKEMLISFNILYKGQETQGTTNVEVFVTNPNGSVTPYHLQERDMSIGETETMRVTHVMSDAGKYTAEIILTPPEAPYLDHVFDENTVSLTMEELQLEKKLVTTFKDSVSMTEYSIRNPNSIGYNHMVHAVINLPDDHNYEKIALVNGEFVREYPVSTTDIYMRSASENYQDVKVKLVKEGNLLPLADAGTAMKEYVGFYSRGEEFCDAMKFCADIDAVKKAEEFPTWVMAAVLVGAVVASILKKKTSKKISNPTSLGSYAKEMGP